MKTLNAKRITTLAAGAALLGLGLAFAGPITFQNVPIISNSGQPVAQIVIGSTAKPIDGVTAANIAAAIGNLAYTSQPVTATVNATQAKSVLGVSVSSASYALSNPQIWLNRTGTTGTISGTYAIYSLIGSVINRGLITGSPASTKALQTSVSTYAYENTHGSLFQLTASPADSPYSDSAGGAPPVRNPPTAGTNGGGITFRSFQSSGDNILQLTNAQIPSLLSNAGNYGETESLWLTGFPVFNQTNNKPPGTLDVLSTDGAYMAQFNKPIANTLASGAVNHASISLLGSNWTILNYYNIPSTAVSGGVTATTSGSSKIQLASSLTPLTTVYVGHNLTSGGFTVQLTDLGQPNGAGTSPASLDIYYKGALTNVTQIFPSTTPAVFNISGHNLYVLVNSTFAGLYAYQKWAKMQLYSNVWNVTSGQPFNKTLDGTNWTAILEWTNRSSGTVPDALAAIIIYGASGASKGLTPGESFSWITDPVGWKATFTGDTLIGSGNYDAVTFQSQDVSTEWYQNGAGTVSSVGVGQLGAGGAWTVSGSQVVNDKGINESAAELVLTSQIPNAFIYSGGQGNTVKWDLTPWGLTEAHAINSLTTNAASATINAILNLGTINSANYISTTYPLYVTVVGNQGGGSTSYQFTFNGSAGTPGAGGTANVPVMSENSIFFDNVTGIVLNRPIPGASVFVNAVSTTGNSEEIASLAPLAGPTILYPNTNSSSFQKFSTQSTVQYNQQNGQSYTTWSLAGSAASQAANEGMVGHAVQYFTLNTQEYPVYPYSTSLTDNVAFGMVNNTGGIAGESSGPFFQVNYSVASGASDHGLQNNVTYISTQPHSVNAQTGWITERGSKVAGISPGTVSIDFAKAVDTMKIVVAPATTSLGGSSNSVTLCPGAGLPGIGLGQSLSVCGIANTTLAKVSANITVGAGANFTITGISNIKATPSVTSATTPVLLSSLATTAPIAVLDSNANAGSNLILIGSGFVNSLSGQLQSAYNISMTPTTEIYQAYGSNRVLIAGYYGNQTNDAGNKFIQQLYAQASA